MPESTGDAGSNFAITPWSDAGAMPVRGASLQIERSTGKIIGNPHAGRTLDGMVAFEAVNNGCFFAKSATWESLRFLHPTAGTAGDPRRSVGLGFDTNGMAAINLNDGADLGIWSSGATKFFNFGYFGGFTAYTPQSGSYSIIGNGKSEGGAILGSCSNPTYYGMNGAVFSSSAYSFYGNCQAYISAGAWGVSDPRFKTLDPNPLPPVLDIVTQIPVRAFAWKQDTSIGTGQVNENDFGWFASDVEPLIPEAINDVGVPPHDLELRAFLAGVGIPTKETPEAEALAARTDLTMKAMSDHHMLAVLWQAVQELAAKVAVLEGAP
jgi:hypothetical protein